MSEIKAREEKDWRVEDVENLKKKFWAFRKICYGVFFVFLGLMIVNVLKNQISTLIGWVIGLFGGQSGSITLAMPVIFLWFGLITPWIAWYLSHCLKIVRAWERLVIMRVGMVLFKAKEPGVRWTWYGLDKIRFVKMWDQVNDPKPQEIITGDNIVTSLDPIIYFRVIDPLAFTFGAENPIQMMANIAQGEITAYCGEDIEGGKGKKTFEVIRAGLKDLGQRIADAINEKSENKPVKDKNTKSDDEESGLASTKDTKEKDLFGIKSRKTRKGFWKTITIPISFIFDWFKKESMERKFKQDETRKEFKKRGWGIHVFSVQVQGLKLPPDVQIAMQGVTIATKEAQAKVEEAKGQAEARKTLADVRKYEIRAEGEGEGAAIIERGKGYNSPGGERAYGTDLVKVVKDTDKIITMSLGGGQDEAMLTKMVGALAGGISALKDKKE